MSNNFVHEALLLSDPHYADGQKEYYFVIEKFGLHNSHEAAKANVFYAGFGNKDDKRAYALRTCYAGACQYSRYTPSSGWEAMSENQFDKLVKSIVGK